MRGVKRQPGYVPAAPFRVLDCLSKSDLMEVVWDYAATSIGDSAEDPSHNNARVQDILNRLTYIHLGDGGVGAQARRVLRVQMARAHGKASDWACANCDTIHGPTNPCPAAQSGGRPAGRTGGRT